MNNTAQPKSEEYLMRRSLSLGFYRGTQSACPEVITPSGLLNLA